MRPLLFFVLFAIFLTSAHTSFAQESDTAKVLVYGEFGIARGTHKFLKTEINTVFNYNNIASLILFHQFRDGQQVPSDYYNDRALLGNGKPKERFTAIGLMYGKMIFLKRDITRLSLKGGLVFGNMRMPSNFSRSGPYYSYTTKDTRTVGLIVDPTIEFPIARGFALNFGGYAILAPAGASAAGLQMSISLGMVSNM